MKKIISAAAAVLWSAFLTAEPVTNVAEMSPDGPIQKIGTVAGFRGKIVRGDGVPEDARVRYEEYFDGILRRKGTVRLGEEVSLERTLDRPGWYEVRLRTVDKNGREIFPPGIRRNSIGRGLMVEPEKLTPSSEKPADFDEFWESRRKMLDKVPLKELERREIPFKGQFADRISAYDVKVSCAGSMPVSGVLTMPKNAAPKSLPAIVFYQGAGVTSAGVIPGYGILAITFQMNANGIENLREREYYTRLSVGALKNYWTAGKNDREKFHFHDMFMRVMRSLDYVKSLPEWNGKVLVVSGGSQGGAQAVAAAALDPQVTLMIAEVPAMCDHSGFLMTPPRLHGWPMLYGKNGDPAVVKCASYYDMVNFAGRIRCESHVSTGALDHVCPPCGVAVLFNSIAAEKKYFYVHPAGEHTIPQIDNKFRGDMLRRIVSHFNGK